MLDFCLFVWNDVLGNYGPGLMVVCARSVDEARQVGVDAWEKDWRASFSVWTERHESELALYKNRLIEDMETEPEIYPIGPVAFWLEGTT